MVDESTSIPDPDEKRWHVNIGGKKQGPFSDAEMAALAASRRLKPKSMAWRTGLLNWQMCASIPELAHLFGDQPLDEGPAEIHLRIPIPKHNPLPELGGKIREAAPEVGKKIRALTPHAQSAGVKLLARLRGVSARHWMAAGTVIGIVAAVWVWRTFIYTPPHDDLISIYSVEDKGEAKELLRIEKSNEAYFLAEKLKTGFWGRPEPVRAMNEKELAELFGENWEEASPLGLVKAGGKSAVLRVNPGWTNGEFTCKTGYFVMTEEGPLEVVKTEERALAMPSLARKTPEPTPKPEAAMTEESDAEADPPARRKRAREASARELGEADPPQIESWEGPRGIELSSEPMVVQPPAEAIPTRAAEVAPPVTEGKMATAMIRPITSGESLQVGAAEPVSGASSGANMEANEPPSANAMTPPATATPAPPKQSPAQELAEVRRRAESARAGLAGVEASGHQRLKEEYLKHGDSLMETSRQREREGDLKGAVFYAQQAAETHRKNESSLRNAGK